MLIAYLTSACQCYECYMNKLRWYGCFPGKLRESTENLLKAISTLKKVVVQKWIVSLCKN